MAKPEDYRRYAAECLRLAQRFRNQAEAALLLEMAERWRDLAQRAESGVSKSADENSGVWFPHRRASSANAVRNDADAAGCV